jgi:hypothetical protein
MALLKSLITCNLFCFFLLPVVSMALGSTQGIETVFRKSDPLWRPADVPLASDVIIRSLRPRVGTHEHNSIAASKAFHATRHEWTYLRDDEASVAFINQARNMGILVGGGGSGASHQVQHLTEMEIIDFCAQEIDGSLYVMPHKRGWDNPPGQGSVFSDEYLRIHTLHYARQLDMGATSLQRDEGWMAISQGYDFNPKAIDAFRKYLKRNTTLSDRHKLGIGEPMDFDVVGYFAERDPPVSYQGRWFPGWIPEDPIKQLYDQFIVDGVVDFYRRLRAALNDHAGRPVAFSCNNTSLQQWTPAHLQFDWAMSELMFETANPQHLYDRFRAGMEHGKVQVISTPKPLGQIEDYEAFRELNRKVIAQAYSVGGLCKAPWDLFLQTVDGRGRYFGDPAHYADLYGFVRGMSAYLEGFEEAAAYGPGILDVHGWENHPLRVRGSEACYAFLRVRPRDADSPVVIHVVNWGDGADEFEVQVKGQAIGWDADNRVVRLLRPAPYDQRLHRLADSKQERLRPSGMLRGPAQQGAYQKLIQSTLLEAKDTEDGWLSLSGIQAEPWSVIVIEKL